MKQEIKLTQVELIRTIADKKGLRDSSLLEKFFAIRFPSEMDESYIGEWVTRFMSGNPVCYMDILSKKSYLKAIVGEGER